MWELWMQEQEALLAEYPYRSVLAAMPNDGYFDGHCTDSRSRAWDPDPSETDVRIKINWANGASEEWRPLSDRHVTFANTLADMVAKRFPGKELYVATNAYGDVGRPKPVRAVPRDNVLIIGVNNFHGRDHAFHEQHKADFLNWTSISKTMIWRPNLGNQGARMWGLPDVPFQELMDDFRFVADRGVAGVFFDTPFEHWATTAPYYYLIGQLAWNPRADGHAILEDYFRRCYGPAAAQLADYWRLMETKRGELVHTVASVHSAYSVPAYYDSKFFAEAENLIARARTAAGAIDGVHARRIDFTRCGLAYTRAIVEIREQMQQFEQAEKEDRDALSEAVLRMWEDLEEMTAGFPEFAIHFKRMGGAPDPDNARAPGEKRSGAKRVTGLHPAVPVKHSVLKEIAEAGLDLQ